MRLGDLAEQSGVQGELRGHEVQVDRLTDDSRACGPGTCFVAIRGTSADGHDFLAQAIDAGASAVVCEDDANLPANLPRLKVADTRQAIGPLAQALRGWPARQLACVGITGTNGKTTVAWLLRELLRLTGHGPALLGTLRYELGETSVPAGTTTPGPIQLAELCERALNEGCDHLVMEASSHALDQRRTEGIPFRAAVFTNLSGDHLDYHGTVTAYKQAKRRLFEALDASGMAILNGDDPVGREFIEAVPGRVINYGLSPLADVQAVIREVDVEGTRFELATPESRHRVRTPLIGRHNVYNALAAASAGRALGIEWESLADALEAVRPVPGRLQRVPGEAPFSVFVDYAHTDDALANVLGAVEPLKQGRLIVVFGCGGDRDRTKRPRMAAQAARYADRVYITSDNPRSEDPDTIIDEILVGFTPAELAKVTTEADRARAIELAIADARAGDVVVIAGKGHEDYQIIGDCRLDFSDAEHAARALAERGTNG